MTLDVKGDGSQGKADHDILDAWVYVAGDFIGVFELPASVPVLASDTQDLIIIAGIKNNGISTDRLTYPFYESYNVRHKFVPGKQDTVIPVIGYRDAVSFPWLEDFEDQTISLEKSGSATSVDSIFLIDDPAIVYNYNGTTERFSAGTTIDTGYQIMEFSSAQVFDLPRNEPVYLELNFRCETELIVGIYPITGSVIQGIPIVTLFPTDGKWKKVYVSLAEDINLAQYQGVDFRVFLASQKNDDQQADVYIDNIKLIHF